MSTFKVERYGVLLKTTFQVGVASTFKIEVTPGVLPLALKRIVTASEYERYFVSDLQVTIGGFNNRWRDAIELNAAYSYSPHRLVKIDGPIVVEGFYTGKLTGDKQFFHEEDGRLYEFGIVVYGSKTSDWIHP